MDIRENEYFQDALYRSNHEPPNIAYALDCISVETETCRTTIQLDNCGPVKVKPKRLKVVGCILDISKSRVQDDRGIRRVLLSNRCKYI